MGVYFCLPHPVAVSAFMICRGLCACSEMLCMCVLYVNCWSKQCFPTGAPWSPCAPRCIAKGSSGDDITNK